MRDRGDLSWVVIIGGFIVGIIAMMFIGVYGLGWFQKSTANFRGDVKVKESTRANGAYRIATYDHFFDLCSGVQSLEASVANEEAEMKTASDARKAQLAATITAQYNRRAELINQYNADASKDYTQGQFRDSDLPYRLYLTVKETQCSA